MTHREKKLCLIASAGGHLDELRQLKDVMARYPYYFVVPGIKSTEKMQDKKYLVHDAYRKNKATFYLGFLVMFFEQLPIFLKEKPDVVITTGAGVAIPTCVIAKLFHKKVIYIESIARIHTPNRTGKLIYKFADLFIVQWESLLTYYPKAVYGGWIY